MRFVIILRACGYTKKRLKTFGTINCTISRFIWRIGEIEWKSQTKVGDFVFKIGTNTNNSLVFDYGSFEMILVYNWGWEFKRSFVMEIWVHFKNGNVPKYWLNGGPLTPWTTADVTSVMLDKYKKVKVKRTVWFIMTASESKFC